MNSACSVDTLVKGLVGYLRDFAAFMLKDGIILLGIVLLIPLAFLMLIEVIYLAGMAKAYFVHPELDVSTSSWFFSFSRSTEGGSIVESEILRSGGQVTFVLCAAGTIALLAKCVLMMICDRGRAA